MGHRGTARPRHNGCRGGLAFVVSSAGMCLTLSVPATRTRLTLTSPMRRGEAIFGKQLLTIVGDVVVFYLLICFGKAAKPFS